MKILIDQNISHRIIPKLNAGFSEVFHIKNVNLIDNSDTTIFKFAQSNNFEAIITMDDDFQNIIAQHGAPPKIIWIRTGNCSTNYLAQKLNTNLIRIKFFLSEIEFDTIEIF